MIYKFYKMKIIIYIVGIKPIPSTTVQYDKAPLQQFTH